MVRGSAGSDERQRDNHSNRELYCTLQQQYTIGGGIPAATAEPHTTSLRYYIMRIMSLLRLGLGRWSPLWFFLSYCNLSFQLYQFLISKSLPKRLGLQLVILFYFLILPDRRAVTDRQCESESEKAVVSQTQMCSSFHARISWGGGLARPWLSTDCG